MRAARSVHTIDVQITPLSRIHRSQHIAVRRSEPARRLPDKMQFGGTTVGGLPGLDQDPRTGTWYFISEDRQRYNAEFVTFAQVERPSCGERDSADKSLTTFSLIGLPVRAGVPWQSRCRSDPAASLTGGFPKGERVVDG
jgi:hypothetical protein